MSAPRMQSETSITNCAAVADAIGPDCQFWNGRVLRECTERMVAGARRYAASPLRESRVDFL